MSQSLRERDRPPASYICSMPGRYDRIPDVFPALRSPHALLREVNGGDADAWFLRNSDPEVVFPMGGDLMLSPRDALAAIDFIRRRFREKTMIRWGIVPEGRTQAIGTTGFNDFTERDARAELGYGLDREWWGQGLMTEANREVIDFGFRTLELNRIEATVVDDNERSLRVLEKLGFRREGLLREHHFVAGRPRDFWMLSVLRREWLG